MSAQNYTIREVSSRTRDWDGQGGSKNRSYYVKVDGDERVFEIAQKVDRDPPKVGDTLEATVESRDHNGETYYKLKRVYQQGGRGGGGKSPSEQRRIAMQASQKVAADVCVARLNSGGINAGEDLTAAVMNAAKRLYDQVESVA